MGNLRSSRRPARLGALVCFAVLFHGFERAEAVCPPPRSPSSSGSDPYRYSLSLAESFAHAKAGLEKAPPTAPGSNPGTAPELTALASRLSAASEDYKCAAALVAPYAKSSDQSVALSAQAATVTYGALIQLDDQKRQMIQSVLDGRLTRAILAERLNRRLPQVEETWRTLISATVMGTFALVVPPAQEDAQVSRLRISGQQRKEIADRLDREFGSVVKEPSKRGEAPLVGAARLLYGFVTNNDWQSSDAP